MCVAVSRAYRQLLERRFEADARVTNRQMRRTHVASHQIALDESSGWKIGRSSASGFSVKRHTVAHTVSRTSTYIDQTIHSSIDDRSFRVSPILLVSCYSVFASMYMLVSLVAPFFPKKADEWGISPTQTGFIVACDPLGELLSTAVATWILAKVGMTNAGVFGMIANGVSSMLFGLAPLLTHDKDLLFAIFTVMRLVNGAATNITYVAMFTLLCCLQPDKIGQVTGNTAVLSTIGLIMGPPFGGMLDKLGEQVVLQYSLNADWQFAIPFAACSVVLVFPSILLWKARDVVKEASSQARQDEEGEEEEDLSFSAELKRMASVFNRTMFAVRNYLSLQSAPQTYLVMVYLTYLLPVLRRG